MNQASVDGYGALLKLEAIGNRAVGLLFAGPRKGGDFLIANPIDEVLAALRIEIRRDLTILKSDSIQM